MCFVGVLEFGVGDVFLGECIIELCIGVCYVGG